MRITIFTDGGALNNPGPGGYGVVMRYGKHMKTLSGGFRKTTNNRMELMAVIKALEALKKEGLHIDIYTDSQYVQKAVTLKWVFNWEKTNFKGKKNADLWKQFLPLFRKHHINFHWVKGHAGIEDNELCDQLVQQESRSNPREVDYGYERENA